MTAQDAFKEMIRDTLTPALRELAAAEDEDLQVRWEARYAIRLAALHDSAAD